MDNLKKRISRYMQGITALVVLVIIIVACHIYILNAQASARDRAASMFVQVEQLLQENQQELAELERNYSETCLHNAQAIAYMIEHHSAALHNVQELRKIAEFMEVDEIHIFDTTGCIFAGTHPEYFDYTFESGEQMMYFKPMLEDRSLKLVQDITPNTAEEKLMQYSALWSENGEYIVQVGMEPEKVMRITEKNELSYIFSLLKVNVGGDCYAIDAQSGEIVGATLISVVGKQATEVGLDMEQIKNDKEGFHAIVNGVNSYCVFTQIEGNLVGRVVSNNALYADIGNNVAGIIICCILMALVQVLAVVKYMNRYVVKGIYEINDKLRSITAGRLEGNVSVQTSIEFKELSTHINEMVKNLLDNNKKLSYVLSKTNMPIGIYEYNEQLKKVRFTEDIPDIFNLDEEQVQRLASDDKLFMEFMNGVRENPVFNEENLYKLSGVNERYVRVEEVKENGAAFGVAIDMTEEVAKRKRIEAERDIDWLTGLYNRRGVDIKLSALFKEPAQLGHGALIMLDADGLKDINDKYGHEKGDIYLKEIANVINGLDSRGCVAARQGGDEYIVLLYHYDSDKELLRTIAALEYVQKNSTVHLSGELEVPLRFSYGYTLTKGRSDYKEMLKEADDRMYANKRERKSI